MIDTLQNNVRALQGQVEGMQKDMRAVQLELEGLRHLNGRPTQWDPYGLDEPLDLTGDDESSIHNGEAEVIDCEVPNPMPELDALDNACGLWLGGYDAEGYQTPTPEEPELTGDGERAQNMD